VSPATTHIFHSSYRNEIVKPNFFRQDQAYTLKDGVASAAEPRSSEQQNAQVVNPQPQAGDAPMKCPFAH